MTTEHLTELDTDARDRTQSDALEQIFARALGAPHDHVGLALALRPVIRCLGAAAKLDPAHTEVVLWYEAAGNESLRLGTLALSKPQLLAATDFVRRASGYGDLLVDWPLPTRDGRFDRVLAVMGRVIAAYASANSSMPAALVKGVIATLRAASNSTKSTAWLDLARDFPGTLEEVRTAQKRQPRPNVRSFLVALEMGLSIPIVSPEVVLQSMRRRTDPPKSPDQSLTDDGASDDSDDTDDSSELPKSVISWLVQRANWSGVVGRYSPSMMWDALTPREVVSVCGEIYRALGSNQMQRGYAVLALTSLVSSLPARLAMNVPWAKNGDLWLDPNLTHLRWNLGQIIGRDRARFGEFENHGDHSRLVVDIALPACVSEAGRTLGALPAAHRTLGQWLASTDDESALRDYLISYRAWLRALRPAWLHGVYDARFAVSLAQFYREQCGDVVTSLLALDFREVALGMLHYVSLPRRQLWSHSDRVYRCVGLGPAALERR